MGLPLKTTEGYHVLLYRLSDCDYSKLNFADAVRMFCMFNDVKLSEDHLSEGYIVIFDMKGCSLGHLTRVTLPALRAFMHYIQVGLFCKNCNRTDIIFQLQLFLISFRKRRDLYFYFVLYCP